MTAMDIYRALWRRRFLIVILTAATVGSAWFLASRQTKIYEASTLVRVQQRVTDQSQAGGAIAVSQHLAQTYANIVTTNSIEQRIYKVLDGRVPPGEVSFKASPVQDLELLWISAKGPNPAHTADAANAAPVALRQFIAQTGTLRDQIVTVNKAGVPSTPVAPNVTMIVAIAFLVGLIFNGGLALLFEFLSDRLPEVDDLESVVGRPVLATVPPLVFSSGSSAAIERIAAAAPTSGEHTAIRSAGAAGFTEPRTRRSLG